MEGGHICLRGALGRQRYSEQGGAISMVSKTLGELQGGNYGSSKMRPSLERGTIRRPLLSGGEVSAELL